MPAILLVRHGQALDPMQGGYDGLSELGRKQAAALAPVLARMQIAQHLSGTLERQVLTAALAAGQSAVRLPELNEHAGHGVVTFVLEDPATRADAQTAALLADTARFSVGRAVAAIMRGWALGRIAAPVDESFAQFRSRVAKVLPEVAKAAGDSTAVAFTSGGFIGAAVAHALGLGDEHAVELGVQVDNASITELRFSRKEPNRFVLKRFNVVAHLEPDLLSGL